MYHQYIYIYIYQCVLDFVLFDGSDCLYIYIYIYIQTLLLVQHKTNISHIFSIFFSLIEITLTDQSPIQKNRWRRGVWDGLKFVQSSVKNY